MSYSNQLSLEQEFKLALYKQKINKLDNKSIKSHLKATLRQMMIKDNIIKYFIKNNAP
uniref:Uncharacterized protein ycf18 n=1 Tax=Rhodymenia pseudopalmata TaxID=31502 RepID=A0A1C9C7I5_RHOPU|nr:phycobilisome degradation protein [Rhodymenia pseudopalmata]AOM64355.1 phycobilisome degradation protein [Rhodymenia pseudopalmata]